VLDGGAGSASEEHDIYGLTGFARKVSKHTNCSAKGAEY
jgi:hypothetical protein